MLKSLRFTVNNSQVSWIIAFFLLIVISLPSVRAETFSADFRGTDIHEFINTVSKNMGKTIIIDNSVKGKVTVRSYQQLNNHEYYQFFLNVLDVHGYAVVTMPNNVLKVVPAKEAKKASLAQLGRVGEGDEIIMRNVALHNVSAKSIATMLRQLNSGGADNSGSTVTWFPEDNSLLISGRADNVNALAALAAKMDNEKQTALVSVPLKHASAAEVMRIIRELMESTPRNDEGESAFNIAADERTNTLLLAGDSRTQTRISNLIAQLDKETTTQGSTRVIRLKYGKAQNLVEVLTGISGSLGNKGTAAAPVSVLKNMAIKADEHTNSLIINAAPDVMRDLEAIIEQLDVRRAQVLVEAIIVEMQDADGLNFGIQWANKFGGGTQFPNTNASISTGMSGGMGEILKNVNGLATGFYTGNWAALLTAISSSSKNNILATPSIVTLDNENAEFSVGQDVPILTGSQTTNSDNVFNTVARKTVGVKLKVKPQINKGDSVLLQIEQEVSSVADNATAEPSALGATFNVRNINNAVLVESGETVVIGGLLDRSHSDNESAVPLLSRIPLLGALFRASTRKDHKRNLIMFIRPTIIRSSENYGEVSSGSVRQFQHVTEDKPALDEAVKQNLQRAHGEGSRAFIRAQQQLSAFFGASD